MADVDDDIFAGLDGPRPLPPALRERLVAALAEPLAPPLAGADAPRPLPALLRARLLAVLLPAAATATAMTGAPPPAIARRRHATRALGAAAAVLVVLGLVAAATRPVTGIVGDLAAATSTTFHERAPIRVVVPTTPPSTVLPGAADATTTTTSPPVVALAESDPAYARLETFPDCDALLDWVKDAARPHVDEYGIEGLGLPAGPLPAQGAPGSVTSDRAPVGSTSAGSTGRSATNVQEAGVDEPDLMKVGDHSLVVLTSEGLQLVDTSSGTPVLASTVPANGDGTSPLSLLLDGSTALILGNRFDAGGTWTRINAFDVADPAHPAGLSAVDLAGRFIDARVVDGVAHVVTGFEPGPFDFTYPADPTDPTQVQQAIDANRDVVDRSTIGQWVPQGVACDAVRHPRDFAGVSTTTVWDVPVADPGAATATALVADPGTVYATADHLYIATQRWEYREVDDAGQVPATVRTNIHGFALDAGGSRYEASGSVPGYLHSSYALSERDGYLRVASTDVPPWLGDVSERPSTSSVTVLGDDHAGDLVAVGSVGDLGAGQAVAGVRFVDDTAFVVTFRWTDPLYTVDLADPADPGLRGQLEVPGFSAYLHPLPDGELLGVGSDAGDDGRVTGGAVSLYDVHDLDHPDLRSRLTAPGVTYWSNTDPHAFLLWDPAGLVVLPETHLETATAEDGTQFLAATSGFDVFSVAGGGLTQVGHITHAGHGDTSQFGVAYRAAMVDGVLYTLSSAGVLASDPSTLQDLGWAALPGSQPVFAGAGGD